MRDLLATLQPVLDESLLADCLGQRLRPTRLRLKPGLSTLAAVVADDGTPGWLRVATEQHRAKIDKAIEWGREYGSPVQALECDGLLIAHGELPTEPGLHRAVASLAPGQRLDGERLLRHNPGRRIVARTQHDGAPTVLRLHAAKGAPEAAAGRAAQVAAGGVRTPTVIRRTSRTSVWPWVGETDLLHVGGDRRGLAADAGAQLARLHALDLPGRELDLASELASLVSDLEVLDAALGSCARGLLARLDLGSGESCTIHGDWSADQVAVGEEVWILDLDRLGRGPAGFDAGSFHAVELLTGLDPVTTAMVDGHGGALEWERWVAPALLLRIMEPLRAARADWRVAIADRLAMVEDWVR